MRRGNRVRLHVLRHIEADELDAERDGQLARQLGLADAGRAGEEERADRLLRLPESRARNLDRVHDLIDGVILSVDDALEIGVEPLQPFLFGDGDGARRDFGHARNDVFDVVDAY